MCARRGFVARALLFALLFLAGYGLAASQYIGTVYSLVGVRSTGLLASNWIDYLNGLFCGVCLMIFIVMLVRMPLSVRAFLKKSFAALAKRNSRVEDELSC